MSPSIAPHLCPSIYKFPHAFSLPIPTTSSPQANHLISIFPAPKLRTHMEFLVSFSRLAPTLAVALVVLTSPAYCQINTPCSPSMLASITPCMNFLTNSTRNGTTPTADCCSSLRNLTGNGMDCLCLVVTGSVPFQVPINRTLAIALPRACNMPGVPVQCKAIGSPVPAPGPVGVSPGPTTATTSPTASPEASAVPGPTSSTPPPESDTTTVLTPPSSTGDTGAPTATTGSRPVLTPPSAAKPSYSFSSSLQLVALGFVFLKYY